MFRIILATVVMATALPAQAAPKTCPPGLAKKSPSCVPPGLAKKGYRIGDRVAEGDYIVIRNPDRYGLDRDGTYYRIGNSVFRVDRETREILDLIGAVAAVLD